MRTRQGGFHQEIPCPGPGRYLLTFDLKAQDLIAADASQGGSFSAYVHVVRKDGSHGANLGRGECAVRDGSFDWLRREVPVNAPANAKTLTVILQFQRVTGTVWVDNVTFRPVMP